MNIDCEQCTAAPRACGDCVVSVLLGLPESFDSGGSSFAVIADEHVEAMAVLAQGGLIPPLRLITGGAVTPNPGAKRRAG